MRWLLAALMPLGLSQAEHAHNAGDVAVISAAQGPYLYSAQPVPALAGGVMLRRISPDGVLYWSQSYGRSLGEEATALGVVPDGGVLLAGARKRGCFLARWDAQGRLGWESSPEPYGQCRPAVVIADALGSVYTFASVSNGRGGFEAVVLAFSPKGEQRWRWRYPAADTAYAQSLQLEPRGDRLRGHVLRHVGPDFVEEFFRLDLEGRPLDR